MGLPVGSVAVGTAGSREQVSASEDAVIAVAFRARESNAGPLYVGDDTVSPSDGYEGSPGDEVRFRFARPVDLRRFYVDAANDGDRLDYAGVAA